MKGNSLFVWIALLPALWVVTSCKKGELLPNIPPETGISVDSIRLSGDLRLNSTVRLSWYGNDIDGTVDYFEYSINQGPWMVSFSRDSTFLFPLEQGSDTTDIKFEVRSVDNSGDRDPSPAELIIPLKNSRPVVEINDLTFPKDTSLLAVSFRWRYYDLDGDHTVRQAFIKINNGNWTEIDRSKSIITLLGVQPESSGPMDAELYYNQDLNSNNKVPGFINEGSNVIYMKVSDLAGAESIEDTSSVVFVKRKKADLLVVNGQNTTALNAYQNLLSKADQQYDLLDMMAESGKYIPYYWNPTFSLVWRNYPVLFINSDQSLIVNPSTGNTGVLLEFMAPVLQHYTDNGGKSFITTSFPPGYDIGPLRGVLPIDSISLTTGQAVLQKDSVLFDPSGNLPALKAKNLLLGMDPVTPSADGIIMYKAHLTPFGAWKGPDNFGIRRKVGNEVRQVFFSTELYLYDQNIASLEALFQHIFKIEFK